MRRGILLFLMVMLAATLASAAETTPASEAGQDTTVAVAPELSQADLEFAALLQQNSTQASFVCESSSAAATLFGDAARPIGGGQLCGGNVCGKFKYCCNPSCGICVYYGMSCTQQSCI